MGFPHRRRLVTLLDVGVMPSGGGEAPGGLLEGLGVWYRADQGITLGTSGPVAADFVTTNSEYLSIPTNSSLRLGNTPWTVGGWVFRSLLALQVFASKSVDGTTVDWEIYADGSGYAIARAWNGTAYATIYAPVGFNAGSWRFMILSYDGAGTLTLQVDVGALYSAGGGHFTDSAGGGILLGAGQWNAPGTFYSGRMQNWFMFARGLDATERAFLFNAGAGRRYEDLDATFRTGLRAWWPLNEGAGSRRDQSGNSNTLTDNNTVMSNVGLIDNGIASGAPITVWEDSGPNDYHLGASGATSPGIYVGERNGKPVVRFDGTTDHMVTGALITGSDLAGPQAQTVFLVHKQLSTDGMSVSYGWDSSGTSVNVLGAHLSWSPDNVLYYDTGAAAAPGDGRLRANRPEPWPDTWHIVEMVRDGMTGSYTIEGNPVSSYLQLPTGTFNPAGISALGVGGDRTGATLSLFQGDIAELIIYNRTLTVAERDTVRNYLKLKWGIAQNKLMHNTIGGGYILLGVGSNDRLAIS